MTNPEEKQSDSEIIEGIAAFANLMLLPRMAHIDSISLVPVPGSDMVCMSFLIGPIVDGAVH
jgi:hypothetical protein